MPDACGRTFDETFLSGYLDRALVQGDEQRVRVHLKGCVSCRALLDELTSMRDATMSSTFELPRDEEWSETPRTGASRLLRGLGWRLMPGPWWSPASGCGKVGKMPTTSSSACSSSAVYQASA